MARRLFFRMTLILSTVFLLFGFSACTKGAESGVFSVSPVQGAYQAFFYSVEDAPGYLSSVLLNEGDGRLYALAYAFDGQRQTMSLVSFREDGTDYKTIEYALPDESGFIYAMTADAEGNLWIVTSARNTRDYVLRKLDASGSAPGAYALNLDSAAKQIALSADGRFYIGTDSGVYAFDSAGNEIYCVQVDYFEAMGFSADGTLYVAYCADAGARIAPLDGKLKALGAAIDISSEQIYGFINAAGGGYDLCYFDGDAVYGYVFETQAQEAILNWMERDINGAYISYASGSPHGGFMAYDSETQEIIKISRIEETQVTEKTILTLGTIYPDMLLKNEVARFNRANDRYRIEMLDYGRYNAGGDYTVGLQRMNTDIISGNVPDILDTNTFPVLLYAQKGLLEDLYPYIDADSALSRDDFVQGVLNNLETEGALYEAVPYFSLVTVVGKRSIFGGQENWRLDDLLECLRAYPADTEVFMALTKQYLLDYACSFCLNDFVDWPCGAASFNSDAFIALLEFCGAMPDSNAGYDYDHMFAALQSNETLLCAVTFNEFLTWQFYEAAYGASIALVGFPGSGGSGAILPRGSLAVSAKSAHKNAAWSFVRTFLTEDFQNHNDQGAFATNRKALDGMILEAMTPIYQTDSTGRQTEQPKGGMGFSMSATVDFYAATREQIDPLLAAIDRASGVYRRDASIMSIVEEEAVAYFAGAKTARETANLIQARAQVYVGEQK